jgi:hypothetical protein
MAKQPFNPQATTVPAKPLGPRILHAQTFRPDENTFFRMSRVPGGWALLAVQVEGEKVAWRGTFDPWDTIDNIERRAAGMMRDAEVRK